MYVYIRSVGLSVYTYGIQLYRGVNNLLVLDVPIKRFLTFSYATLPPHKLTPIAGIFLNLHVHKQ